MPLSFPSIVGKIIRRFGVTVGQVRVDELASLTPITDMDTLAWEPESEDGSITVAANGASIVYTVPQGERWGVQAISADRDAGDYSWQLTLGRLTALGGALTATLLTGYLTTETYAETWGQALTLFPGDQIRLNIANFVGGGDLIINIAYFRIECQT